MRSILLCLEDVKKKCAVDHKIFGRECLLCLQVVVPMQKATMAVFAGNYEVGAYDRGLVEIDGMGCAKLCERCTNALNAISSSSIDECVARALRKSLLGKALLFGQ